MKKEIKSITELYKQPVKLSEIGLTTKALSTLKKRKASIKWTRFYSLPLKTIEAKRGNVYNYCISQLEKADDVLRYSIGIEGGFIPEVTFYLYQGKFE